MTRIGVFICHCGANIAGTVDVEAVRDKIAEHPDVVYAEDYVYLCSDPGQKLVHDAIEEQNLDGVVVANCSPNLHEKTFRTVAAAAKLNPYLCEIANIREQCSWPHSKEPERATKKALNIIRATVEKVKRDRELIPLEVPLTKKALVIGGGITGIQTALDIADGGYEVHLVERSPSIGGRMAQLSETFPTLDCPQCIMTPKMTEVAQHPNIRLHTYTEVESVDGYVGNFTVAIRHKATYVNWDVCTGCGDCATKCPMKVDSEYECGLEKRRAIYRPFPQAVPNKFVIDPEHCLKLSRDKCGNCARVCEANAIDYEMSDRIEEIEVGAIVVATGLEIMPKEAVAEYGYGKYPDVVTALQFERYLAPSGPTDGIPRRPSDGTIPKEVVFIQCVGSRDPENAYAYCSRICCMYTGKQAMLYRHAVPDGQAYVFYIDIRSNGKGYEEFIQRAMEEDSVFYLRGRVSKLFEEGGKIRVWGADTLTGRSVEIDADLVVLATAARPASGVLELANRLRISLNQDGWINEAHLKLRPLETLTAGVYIAGAAQFPKDITDCVAQGSGAAGKILALFSNEQLVHDPTVAAVDIEICRGCGMCESICTYDAVEVDEERGVAVVNEALCEGCGACAAACPSGAMRHRNYRKRQILDMITEVIETV